MNNLGYNKFLFILPFDHRSTFAKGMFNISNEELLTDEQRQKITEEKQIIYGAFKKSVSDGVQKEFAAILIDEEFGDSILRDATNQGFVALLTTEKSGQKEFVFEYGDDFGEHIKKYSPAFAKALVRFNPEDDLSSKERQLRELRRLNDFLKQNNFKFLIEVLILPSKDQLSSVSGDKNRYDKEVRPKLAIELIKEFQEKGVEPDVWKMEGMDETSDYNKLVEQARAGGRTNVGVVILGRGAEREMVYTWIIKGAHAEGVIGFAVGRTVFWDPLILLKDNKITREEAIAKISENFRHYYDLFMQGKSNL